jgi:hypothetical protein
MEWREERLKIFGLAVDTIIHQECPRFMTPQQYRNLQDLTIHVELLSIIREAMHNRSYDLEPLRRQVV